MACNCETYTCITVPVDYCNPTVIPLEVEDGQYRIETDFAGATVIKYVDVTDGSGNIIFPEGQLNENYTYTMRIFDNEGELLNDTCYTLKTAHLISDDGGSGYNPAVCVAIELIRKVITVESANLSNGDTTLTDTFFSNTISEIVVGGQSYIIGVDFTQSGNTITAISFGFYDGQILIAKR